MLVMGLLLCLTILLTKSLIASHHASLGAQCSVSLKNVGQALFLYTENNNDFLPHEDAGSTQPPHNECWYDVIQPYFGSQAPERVLQDPSLSHLHTDDLDVQGKSFKFNSRLEGYKGSKAKASPDFRHMSTFSDPKRSILIFDGDVTSSHKNKPYGMHTQVENRHLNKANLLTADGSVVSDDGHNKGEQWTTTGGWIWDPDVSLADQ
jgi:prepilin-type processing-associated H-X9-DG protein